MFKVGDIVFYGTTGVCNIEEVSEVAFGREKKQYLVLRPIAQGGASVMIPTDNQLLFDKMRSVVSKKEVEFALNNINAENAEWCNDVAERNRQFTEIVKDSNPSARIAMLLSLYRRKNELSNRGKKLHIADEKALRDAQRLIVDEFSYVLKADSSETEKMLISKLQKYSK